MELEWGNPPVTNIEKLNANELCICHGSGRLPINAEENTGITAICWRCNGSGNRLTLRFTGVNEVISSRLSHPVYKIKTKSDGQTELHFAGVMGYPGFYQGRNKKESYHPDGRMVSQVCAALNTPFDGTLHFVADLSGDSASADAREINGEFAEASGYMRFEWYSARAGATSLHSKVVAMGREQPSEWHNVYEFLWDVYESVCQKAFSGIVGENDPAKLNRLHRGVQAANEFRSKHFIMPGGVWVPRFTPISQCPWLKLCGYLQDPAYEYAKELLAAALLLLPQGFPRHQQP